MKGFIKQFLVVSVILIMVGCRMSASNTGELDPNALGLKVDAEMNFTPDTGARYVFWWLEGAENCFASQTLITTPLGNKPIDSLEKGDIISSILSGIDFDIKETTKHTFTGKLYQITAGKHAIVVSDIHPLIVFNGRFITVRPVKELTDNMWLYTKDGWFHPNIEAVEYSGMVYNFFLWDPKFVKLHPELLKFRSFFAGGIASADLTTQIALQRR